MTKAAPYPNTTVKVIGITRISFGMTPSSPEAGCCDIHFDYGRATATMTDSEAVLATPQAAEERKLSLESSVAAMGGGQEALVHMEQQLQTARYAPTARGRSPSRIQRRPLRPTARSTVTSDRDRRKDPAHCGPPDRSSVRVLESMELGVE